MFAAYCAAIHLVRIVVGLLHPMKIGRSVVAMNFLSTGTMPLVYEELVCVVSGVHSSLPLLLLPPLLLPRHGEDVYEEGFLKAFLWSTIQLEEDTPSGGALATIDMPANGDGHGLLLEVDAQPIRHPVGVPAYNEGQMVPTSRLLGYIAHSVTQTNRIMRT